MYYPDKIFVKRSIPTVCFALTGINLPTWHASLMQGSYIRLLWTPNQRPLIYSQISNKGEVRHQQHKSIADHLPTNAKKLVHLSPFEKTWCICTIFFVLQFGRLKLPQRAIYLFKISVSMYLCVCTCVIFSWVEMRWSWMWTRCSFWCRETWLGFCRWHTA